MSKGVHSFSFIVNRELWRFIGQRSKLIQSLCGCKVGVFPLRVSNRPVKASSHNISSKLVCRVDGCRVLLAPLTSFSFAFENFSLS